MLRKIKITILMQIKIAALIGGIFYLHLVQPEK
jgi:hypothetical protein